MTALLQPVFLRFLTYVMSSLIVMIPASLAGLIIWNPTTYHLTMSLPALASIAAAAVATSGGIVAKWGIPVPQDLIRGVVLRVITYAVTPLLAMIPASFGGIVTFVPATQIIDVSLGGLVTIALGAIATSLAIFNKWGVRTPAH